METTFLLRFGELILKSNSVRRKMLRRLQSNLENALKRSEIQYKIESSWARFFLTTNQREKTEAVLSHMFGLHSFSVIIRTHYDSYEHLLEIALEQFTPQLKNLRFAVRSKRENFIEISTQQLCRDLGAKLLNVGGSVDLTKPEITFTVELRGAQAFLYDKKQLAAGGSPLGVENRTLSLISGGIDSPVASWLMMRRGCPQDYLTFELGGEAHRGAIFAHLQNLYENWTFGYSPRLYIVPGEPIVKALKEKIPERYRTVMLKRIFYKVGERIARRHSARAIVTGEVIGQVSSQTLVNLHALQLGIDIPVLRPLLTYQKDEIVQRARVIGSLKISEKVQEYCAITPRKPATSCRLKILAQMEFDLGNDEFYDSVADSVLSYQVRDIDPTQLQYLKAITDRVPKHAVWLDLRETPSPALPQPATHISIVSLLENPEQLDTDKEYLLLCKAGTESAEVAHILQEMGYQTFSYQGGIQKLERLLEKKKQKEQRTPLTNSYNRVAKG